MKVWG